MTATLCNGQNLVVEDTLQQQPTTPYVEKLTWGDIDYRGLPWVQNTSLAYQPTHGLKGRHLSLWASHGRYYDVTGGKWLWQRPALYLTHEDLFTQTFAVPLLYPMLEHAGAIVWTPRERCWMREEVIVDNDQPNRMGSYAEQQGSHEWQSAGKGFAWLKDVYQSGENPHEMGTSRMVESQQRKRQPSTITWTPQLPRDGDYAVYVSYPHLSTNVPDAQYVVRHRGISTTIRVNQQMGAGTWVYLGTFDFSRGESRDNCVRLSNVSSYRGTVAADAVRFGGGMGNISRADSCRTVSATLSGLPRYLEAARYSAQWMGIPYYIYGEKNGGSDYGDDILTRPSATNYLARGSVYLPGDSGLSVPIELSLALHSDAGARRDLSQVGTLSIFTSDFEDGILPSGVSRRAARSLASQLLSQAKSDLSTLYGNWTVREVHDKNYGETRVPRIPGVICEMLSHQNFADMKLGHDPIFKFHLARSIYKSILRYTALMHGTEDVVVQPLPVNAIQAHADDLNNRIVLQWKPTADPLEPTATPTSYVVYTRQDEGGWDNGSLVQQPIYTLDDAQRGVLYQFRVEAVNDGGASLPSQVVCACLSTVPKAPEVLIINAFDRLAAPQPVDNDSLRGFNMLRDPGVAYRSTPAFCGPQLNFLKSSTGREGATALGYSSDSLVGTLVCGNTFDYPVLHARDMMSSGSALNISSCSRKALEDSTSQAGQYQLIDIIFGAERSDGYSHDDFKTFTPAMRSVLQQYVAQGGAVLVSGAYVGTDMADEDDKAFTSDVLHYQSDGEEYADSLLTVTGMNTQCSLLMRPNEQHLSTAYTSALQPTGTAFSTMLYAGSRHAAVIAYRGADYRCITLGFPIEQVQEEGVRRALMKAYLEFLAPPSAPRGGNDSIAK